MHVYSSQNFIFAAVKIFFFFRSGSYIVFFSKSETFLFSFINAKPVIPTEYFNCQSWKGMFNKVKTNRK